MSSSVESRIVTMKFDNSTFERGASQSLSTLGKLKAAMNFDTLRGGMTKIGSTIGGLFSKFTGIKNPFAPAQQGLTGLQQTANQFNPSPITGGVTGISKAFVAMSTIAITAISNITNKVVDAGLRLANSISFEPIMAGMREYETNLNSIQTILSNTRASGAGLKDVEAALLNLNKYADQTIYNFSEMARNIGTFTAAGVDLDTSVNSIKGIANLAALSGSNSQQASTAMYQLSQAISAGRVSLQDWNSVVNAGMGGTVFQRALAETAVAMGEVDAASVKLSGKMKNVTIDGKSFRESIMAKPGEQSWLSSKVLTNTLQQFTGDLSKAELAAQGFSDAQIKAIQATAKNARDAATKVKTITQLIDVAKETAQSGWAQTWQIVFGDFNEAKKSFTTASETINGFLNAMSDARNKVLGDWKALGGRTVLIEGISSAFQALVEAVRPIGQAFRDIFPPATGQDLYNLTQGFADLMERLRPSEETVDNLRRIFGGFFSVIKIGIAIVKGVAGVIGDLVGTIGAGEGGILSFAAGIADFVTALGDAVTNGGLLEGFFGGLTTILAIPLTVLRNLAELLGSLFTGFDGGAAGQVSEAIDGIGQRLDPVAQAIQRVRDIFDGFGEFIASGAEKAVEAFAGLGAAIADSFTAESFGSALDAINTGLLAGIVLMLKNFLSGGINVDVGGGMFDTIKETLGGVTDALSTMQTSLKANILLKIAGAVAILAASLLVLSTIDPKKLATALVGMAALFGIMTVALGKLVATIGIFGSLKLPAIAAGLMGIAVAMLTLSLAVKVMASMEFGDMARGLSGIATMLFLLSKAVVPLSANAGGMVRVGAALILVAFALKIMASAVGDFAAFSLTDMAKGLAGVAGALVVLAGGMRLMPSNIFITAAALVVLAAALKSIAGAISAFAAISWSDMGKGLAGVAASLVLIAGAMRLMPKSMLLQAVSLTILAGALHIIGAAVAKMGGLSMEVIAKGLGTLAGALVILAAGLYLMTGTLMGSAALVIAAGALAVLVPVLVALGSMSWEMIIKGLTMLAGTFLIVGAAGILLAPLVPVIFAFSASLLLLGAGLALAGAGALAFATAFGIVVAAGAAGVAVLAGILATIINAIPKALKAFGQGIVEFAKAIGRGAGAFFKAFGAILNGLIRAAMQAIPKIGKLFMELMRTALNIISKMTPQIINAGLRLIVGFLAAISRNVPKIVNISADIIVKFLNGIARNLPRIIQSGVNLILQFIRGITQAINNNSSQMGEAGGQLAVAIVRGMANGISSGVGVIKDAALGVAKSALNAAKDFLGINSPSRVFKEEVGKQIPAGMAEGISTYSKVVDKTAAEVGKSALKTLKASMSDTKNLGPGSMDVRPRITPVLDLSEVRKSAGGISDALNQDKMTAAISYRNASTVSSDMLAAAEAASAVSDSQPPMEIKVEQNNHSPKALSAVEIYRNTKGLLPLIEEGLKASGRN